MKTKMISVLFLFGVVGCHVLQKPPSTTSDSSIIESTILWKAKFDTVTWEPIDLNKMLGDSSRFKEEGNFFKVKDGTKAFGHKALYISMVGIDMIPGPNVILEGDSDEVAQFITKNHGITFVKIGEEYHADLKKDILLCVVPRPSRKGTTLVIGAYLGK